MKNRKFKINLPALINLQKHIVSNDSREYLQGVSVKVNKNRVEMVATTGHILGRYINNIDNSNTIKAKNEEYQFIINAEPLVKLSSYINKLKKSPFECWVHMKIDKKNGEPWVEQVMFEFKSTHIKLFELKMSVIDSYYPDYNRVIPKERLEKFDRSICFSSELLKKFAAFGDKYRGMQLYSGGVGQAPMTVLTSDDEFTGVIMPMRR